MASKIEWCDETINPIQDKIKGKSGRGYHCTKVSEGCLNCYAEVINKRFGNGLPFDNRNVEFELIESELEKPMKWRKPKRIFIQSMGDIFHESLSHRDRNQIFEAMDVADWHTYLLLTKRPDIALDFDKWRDESWLGYPHSPWKDHVWLGVTIEHPKYGYRADYLRKIPAAKRFLSIEPMLSDFSEYPGVIDDMDWVIVGGESGPGARPMHLEWVRSVRDQCQVAGVMFFYKQTIINGGKISLPFLDGQQWAQYPTPGH